MSKNTKASKDTLDLKIVSHISLGIGIGILITNPMIMPHPVRWGVGFIVLAVLIYFYNSNSKK